jgi:branched-chain amino acid transport system ATP-binding protein
MSVLRIHDLKVSFGSARVLERADLVVGAGEIVGLVGRNGAGKTTTLRAVSGLVKAERGWAELDGRRLPSNAAQVARAGVVHIPEGRGMFATLTVRDNLRLGATAVGRRYRGDDDVVQRFPRLEPLLDRRAGHLSGGEQQLVAICRGVLAEPRVLLVDEFSLGLSPIAAEEAISVLVSICRESGMALLVVDQNVRSLGRICDRMYALTGGRTRILEGGDGSVEDAWRAVYLAEGAPV